MRQRRQLFVMFVMYLFMAVSACSTAEKTGNAKGLPRSTPEAQGMSSSGIRTFLGAVANSDIEFHSLMIVRHGYVVAEGWWSPFAPALKHTLYSLSKSFTSTAIGMAVDEGKLALDDKVIAFFPEERPAEISENLAAMRIRDLLTMTAGHASDTMGGLRESDGNWPRAFLAQEVGYEPGTHFLYNTGATYMLSAILQKVTGQTLFDYLSGRLFTPLGIEGADWETDPRGINTGGYGLRVRTEDTAKLGQLYLQKGQWHGKQLVSAEWVGEATRKQTTSQEGDNDWSQGYGYQFWRCKPEPGFYRGDGAFGQFCIVIPQKDVVIAITSESSDMQASMNLVWQHLLPAIMDEGELPANDEGLRHLRHDFASLKLSPPSVADTSAIAGNISGKAFTLQENEWGLRSVTFTFTQDTCFFSLNYDDETQTVACGMKDWVAGSNVKMTPGGLFAVPGRTEVATKIAASATWRDRNTLLMTWRYVENIHTDDLTCSFGDKGVTISFLSSVAKMRRQPDSRRPLEGSIRDE